MILNEKRDLVGGEPLWPARDDIEVASDTLPDRTDVLIIGAGVTGASVAERLTAEGREVTLVDRRAPASGSTSASTALIMWACDTPLIHLAERFGVDGAARRWQRVRKALNGLDRRIDELGIDCGKLPSRELYLAGNLLDDIGLQREADARQAANLPSQFLEPSAVVDRFNLPPRAAIYSTEVFELDLVRLTLGLLGVACERGACVAFPHDVTALEDRAAIFSDGRRIEADYIILATGYERAPMYLPPAFTVGASFALASLPDSAEPSRRDLMVWEASEAYFYARQDEQGRLIAGGGDENQLNPTIRDGMIGMKTGKIAAHLGGALR